MLEWMARHKKWVDLGVTGIRAVLLMTGFALPAWAASASEWMNQWGPIAWVCAGFAGLAVTVFLMMALAYWKRFKVVTQIAERQSAKTDTINPLEDTFRKQRIRLVDLAEPITSNIKNKVFIDCEIHGPANAVFMNGCVFQLNSGGPCDGLVFDRRMPETALNIEGCTFRQCRFYFITFMVPAPLIDDFRKHDWSNINWITSQSVPSQSEIELRKSEVIENDVSRQVPDS